MAAPQRFSRPLVMSVGDDDADRRSLAAARTVCRGGAITLLDVAPHLSFAPGPAADRLSELLADRDAARAARLARLAAGGSFVETVLRTGRPWLEVIAQAQAQNADLVIKPAQTIDGLAGRLMSSTDQHLLRKCPCAVWLRRGAPTSDGPVIAAVDVDEARATEPRTLASLNARILDAAHQMATAQDSPMVALHVWDAPEIALLQRWAPEEAPRYREGEERKRRDALDALMRRQFGAGTADTAHGSALLREGAARSAIPDAVASLEASLLVIGTVSRAGVPGFLIGNTAEDILNAVGCSVLAVKPPGYRCPIEATA
jgi:nucleotide-binding universal stress UspA family protein